MQTLFFVIFIIQVDISPEPPLSFTVFVKISATFGEGDTCEECINIENTPGIENDQDLLGSYKYTRKGWCPRTGEGLRLMGM